MPHRLELIPVRHPNVHLTNVTRPSHVLYQNTEPEGTGAVINTEFYIGTPVSTRDSLVEQVVQTTVAELAFSPTQRHCIYRGPAHVEGIFPGAAVSSTGTEISHDDVRALRIAEPGSSVWINTPDLIALAATLPISIDWPASGNNFRPDGCAPKLSVSAVSSWKRKSNRQKNDNDTYNSFRLISLDKELLNIFLAGNVPLEPSP